MQFRPPGQPTGIEQPCVGGTVLGEDPGVQRHARFGVRMAGVRVGARIEIQVQDLLAPRAEQGEQAV